MTEIMKRNDDCEKCVEIPLKKKTNKTDSAEISNIKKTRLLLTHYKTLVAEINEDFEVVRNSYGIAKSIKDVIEHIENDTLYKLSPEKYSQSFVRRIERLKKTSKYLETLLNAIEQVSKTPYYISERMNDANLHKGKIYYMLLRAKYIDCDVSSNVSSQSIIEKINFEIGIDLPLNSFQRLHKKAIKCLSSLLWVETVEKVTNIFENIDKKSA